MSGRYVADDSTSEEFSEVYNINITLFMPAVL